jgi:hypothetical protein
VQEISCDVYSVALLSHMPHSPVGNRPMCFAGGRPTREFGMTAIPTDTAIRRRSSPSGAPIHNGKRNGAARASSPLDTGARRNIGKQASSRRRLGAVGADEEVRLDPAVSRLSNRRLKPLPPDPFRHQDSAIAPRRMRMCSVLGSEASG